MALATFLLVLSAIAGISSLEDAFLREISTARPRHQAEQMIRAMNLLPHVDDSAEDSSPELEMSVERLVERRVELGIKGDSESEVTVEDLGHHAGYFKLEGTHSARMFYFFFESRRNRSKDPLVLWMTGGPGCGSEVALFYENGPFHIAKNLSLYWNKYGWDKVSNIIFVDQPIGTGFSYSSDVRDIRHDEKGVSKDMYDFLEAFFKKHPEYADRDFYVTGESYAGHYIPAVATNIHDHNKKKDGITINLKGVAIGNGLTQPEIQYEAYGDYALEMKLINEDQYKKISKIYPVCSVAVKLCGEFGTVTCLAALLICQTIFQSILSIAGNINYYDIRKPCVGQLCYDFSAMEEFLNQDSTRVALGVRNRTFVSCNPVVYEAMLVDWMRNLEVGIPALLEDGIKLLVYAGEYDLICNWLGNSRWVTAMDWSGQQSYAEASWEDFSVDGETAGSVSGYGPLTFLKVHDAGHMVPMDQPKNSLEMISRWMKGDSLARGKEEMAIDEEAFLVETF
ncbi:serine carboxypeptidase-like enzyme [Selaginella moellendorffii]|uniref:Carboxypeptidase n=1 Tax=Selaginella moellendorffii TaxID=88036 RepID=D8QPP9_SELML|nr:serine carboxypeptidase-like enzyme [Selaginella moellendorffii]